ncbi:endolytic transglycosylase MltG [Thiolinea disciformis]|uniref:endolytic transglycosylase MltG n=1 Tax=Thiolinea disciformis TaxID=125614 RepID=UPI000379AA82|nr:endolytic transglycosylase MltG [Thiolinea disciformis]
MKRFLMVLLALLVVVLGAAAYAYYQFEQFGKQPIPLLIGQTKIFEVKPGSNVRQVARDLQSQGLMPDESLLPSDWLFLAQARKTNLASKIKAGAYELEGGMTPIDVLKKIVSGKTIQYKVTLIEGRTFKEFKQVLRNNEQLEQTLSDADYTDIMAKLGADAGTFPEGWFMPDTYNFPKGSKDIEVLKRSYQAMKDYLAEEWPKRTPHPLIRTPYDALILASIVEKESGKPEERPLVAQVFLNRLEKNMRLQTDPTVIYGLGDAYNGNITKADLQRDTPYNSYTRSGLPPTPIAMPSKISLNAVLHPQSTDALYFVAKGDGSNTHNFSSTYEQHRKAVSQYLQNLKDAENSATETTEGTP